MQDRESDPSDSGIFTGQDKNYTGQPRSRGQVDGEPPRRRPARTPRVLVVDDYADTRAILIDVLTSHGCQVETAEDGVEALEKAHTWRPDILVLDLAMPGIDGFDVARRLRENQTTRDLPLVAYTAYTDPAWRRRAEAAGFSAFLIKPTPPRELVATLRSFLPAEARPISWKGTPNPDDTWTRLAPLRQAYEAALPRRVQRLAQTWEELRTAPAVDEVRMDALSFELYRLDGFASKSGLPEVSRLAGKLQEDLAAWRATPTTGTRAAVDRRMDEVRQAAERWGGRV